LDHIPALVDAIADSLVAPDDGAITANTAVIAKARELGELRYRQRASIHQLLREYDILAGILETFVVEETDAPGLVPPPLACFEVSRRVGRAVRTLMQSTVDTFVQQYTATIGEQTARLDRFADALGHELRNPLSTLQFAADLLARPDILEDATSRNRAAAVVKRNAERALGLIRNLEKITRAERVIEGPGTQRLELAALAQEVARQLRGAAELRGVEIRVGHQLPAIVGDAGQLELVLLNLVSNAIKYSDPAKPARFVEIDGHNGEDTCCVEVRDNGLGIPSGALDRIFERFVRVHAHRDGELGVEGTGLGLTIVQTAVRSLGGSIRVNSVESQGTTFTLLLPRRGAESEPDGLTAAG
jgi:signal transduction histidine kinase